MLKCFFFHFKEKLYFGDHLFPLYIGVFFECGTPAIKKQIRSSAEGIKVKLKPTQYALLAEEISVDTAGISRGSDRKAW